jgi:sporulation protein YlmC with PRC-barrel domain
MRHIQINEGGSIYTRTLQILVYADDVNLTGRSTGWLKDAVVQMEEGTKEVGLGINEEKTKYMINTRNKVCFRNEKHLQVNNYEFERVGEFIVLRVTDNRK